MAIKSQEKNFLIAVVVFGLLVGLAIVLLPLLSGGDKNKAKAPPPNTESVRVEVDRSEPSPPKKPAEKPAKAPEPEPEKDNEEKSADEPPATEATLVLSKAKKVPTDYFEDSSGVAELPRVVERYLDAVKNGSRFMGRLESIALRDNNVLEEQRQNAKKGESLTLQRGDLTKVISYNMKINTPYLSASFDAETVGDFKGDVLVEWIDSASDERIELFFTPISRAGAEGQFRLNMPSDAIPPASKVFVYSATDEMPLIATGAYKP